MSRSALPLPPTVAVFWLAGKFWRAKDTSYLLPGQPTKASKIEFGHKLPPLEPEDRLSMVKAVKLEHHSIYFVVDGRTVYEGPARVQLVYGKRRPDVPHYIIVRAPSPVPAHILTILNNQVKDHLNNQVKEQVNV